MLKLELSHCISVQIVLGLSNSNRLSLNDDLFILWLRQGMAVLSEKTEKTILGMRQ